MTATMLEEMWRADPSQPGRIHAGEAITVEVRVAPWRVVGVGDEATRLATEAGRLCLAAPSMAKALLLALATADFPGHAEATIREALTDAGVVIPDPN